MIFFKSSELVCGSASAWCNQVSWSACRVQEPLVIGEKFDPVALRATLMGMTASSSPGAGSCTESSRVPPRVPSRVVPRGIVMSESLYVHDAARALREPCGLVLMFRRLVVTSSTHD